MFTYPRFLLTFHPERILIKLRYLGAFCLLLIGINGFSQNLITWELSTLAGVTTGTVNSTTNASGIGTGVLGRGAGLTAESQAGGYNSSAWFSSSTATTVADAIMNNDYYEFTLPVNSGSTATITAIKMSLRSSNTGPNTAQLRSSVDNYMTAIGANATLTNSNVLMTFTPSSSIVSTSMVTFRLYGFGGAVNGSAGTGGTMRIGPTSPSTDNDIIVEGSVTSSITTLNINDVSQIEGNSGTTTFSFSVSLSAPAGAGGVTFDISTTDNTATQPSDYTQNSLTGQTIPAGNSTYSFTVLVKGDVTTEPNETFFVNVTNVTGATVSDGQGQGTIQNDDVTLTPIHDIQGPGASSPIVGATVSTRGIVTGIKSNGFFIQEPNATVDADPATSEGILVFTSSAPPAAAVVGALVQVTGTVTEFVPSQDPLQPPLTELTSPTVLQISTGNPLPTSVPLTATFPDPAGPHDQLERLEGMLVSVTSLTVVGPTMGNINETNATATSSGVFYGVITGIARPFREAGIQAPDPAPSGGGTIPPIPRFDSNPERIRVDSDGLVGAPAINVSTSAVVSNLVGPLDYTFRTYTILPDPASPPSVSGGATATAVTTPTASEFTVASYNLQRFFDTVNDPSIGEAVLTTTAFNNRLNKASIGIRNFLKTPDIVGVVEVENLTTLQDLATRINNDAVAASQPNPQYAAYLVEGNDVGGIDVGFLVKTAPVAGATPRVTVNEVVQENKNELFVNPDASTDLLNDRPPLRLNATINHANGASFPVTVIANHLRSLNGVNSEDAGSNDWATTGARVRAKRQKQAESLANLVQARQTATPTERIIVLGDFNAFEVNDGFGHLMATIQGTPVPNNETAVAGDGADLVDPDLVNLFNTTPTAERYSYVFDGNAQSLDHILVNEDVINATLARRVEHPRINADFPETARNDGTTAIRLSDHDPVVSYYQVAAFAPSDLTIAKTTSSTFIRGGTASYNLTVTNSGVGSSSGTYTIMDVMPSGLTITNVSAGSGWDCTSSTATTVSCVSNNVISSGSSASLVTVSVSIANNAPASITNTATISGGGETNTTNNSSSVTSSVISQADLAITKTDGVSTAIPGGTVTYTITASNSGPSNAVGATVTDMFPATLTMVNWTCVGAGGGTCTASGSGNISDMVNLPSGGSVTYTVSATISPSATGTLVNTAIVSAPGGVTDPNPANNSATDTDTFTPQADLAITKTDGVSTAIPGGTVTYTITASNSGPSNAVGATVTDMFPATLTMVNWTCVGAGGGTCTASGSGNISDMVNLPSGGSVTYTVSATISPSATGTLSNTATVSAPGGVTDPNPANNSATDTDVLAPQADLSVTMTDSPDPVAAGDNLTYTITAANAGPSIATSVVISNTLPAGTTFVSLSAPGGWSCTTPAVGAGGTISCSIASLGGGSSVFTLVVAVDPSVANGIVLSNTATIASSTPDPTNPTPGNNSATATTTVTNICSEIGTLTASPNPVCVSSTTTLTASNLVNMNIQGGYGIIFKYFNAPTSTPYEGGTTITTIANSSLSNGGTQAETSTSFATVGNYYLYAILSPAPANVNCRPFATTTLTVLPVHTITLSSLAATEAQTICVNSPMTDITYSLGGGATGATVMGLPMGVTSTVNSGVLTISGTPTVTVGSPFNYNITTMGNNCTVATESGTVTVNTLSTAPVSITGTTTICAGGNTTLTLSGGSAGTGAIAEWFIGTCGGTPAGTGNSITVSPANTTTYFVRYNGTCNTTTCASSTVTVNTLSTAPMSITGTTTICAGGNTTLTLSGGSAGTGAIAEWFTGTCGGTPAGTGNSITVSPANTTTYFVRYNGTCNTTTCASSTVTVNTLSTAPVSITGTTTICAGGNTTLTLSGGSAGTGANAEWFTGTCGGTPAGTGNSITVSPANTTTYFVRYNGTCNTTTCASSTVTVNTLSTAPVSITGTTTICAGGNTTLTLSGGSAGTGAIAEWFTGTCGGTPAGTGNSITVSPSNTTTYFVRYNGTCNTTTCASSTVTVNALPMASISAMPTVVCQNAPFPQITFMGSGGTAPYTFTYKINNGPDLTVVSIGNTAILSQTTAVANTFTYTLVSVKDASSTQCSQSVGSSIMITVNAPPVVSTPQSSLCTGLTLTLSPTSGGTWQSSNPSIATVSNAGLVTAIMAGSVNFTFTQTSTGCSSTTSNVAIKPTPSSNLMASKVDVCANTEVTLNPNCSIPTSTVNWNPGAPTVTPAAATLPYIYKARCEADGCVGNESSVEVRTHRILVDMKDLDVGALPLPIVRAVKDNMAPTNLIQAPVFPRRWTFIANGCDASESAEFKLSGPVLFNTIDNTSTYAMFANEGNSFYSIDHPNYGNGGSFPDGTYTLTINLRSKDGVGGPYPKNRVAVGLLLATRTLEFTVGNPSLRQGVGELETEFTEENWISLLQNPVNEEIVVRLSGKLGEDIDLSLVNLQGQMIQQRGLRLTSSEQNEVLRIGNSPTGLYILKAIKGDKVKTIKVVKVD